MRNAQLAEWILSLVTSPERAAATVGDLLENTSGLGTLWFGVLRTAVSLLWREFSEDPANLMGLAFRGFLLELGMMLGIALVSIIAFVILGLIAGLMWHPMTPADFTRPAIAATAWVYFGLAFWILVPLQVGRWMARRSPGRELAPIVASTILSFVVATAASMFWDMQDNFLHFILHLVLALAWNILLQIPMFAGAAWVRKKQTSR